MLYSNNLTTFITSLVDKENGFTISDEDDILVGAPEGVTSMFLEWEEFSSVETENYIQSKPD